MQPTLAASDLQLPQLELFVRIADAGSLSAAARQLQITPAAASAALKRLETILAVRLIERSTRSMRLTPEGELLREHAQRALGVLDDMRSLLGARRERLEGEIHLAAPSDLGRQVLSPMLDEFLAEHPGLRIALHVSDNMHDLLRERVDLAVRYGELPDSTMVARLLHRAPRVLVASPAYLARHGAPEHPRDLAKHNCIGLYLGGRPQLQWTLVRDGLAITVKTHGNRRADDGALVRQWAVQGLGIAYKSRLDVAADLASGVLVELMPGWRSEPVPLHAVIPAREHMPLRVRRLLDALAEKFARLDAQGDAIGPTRSAAGRAARPDTVRAAPPSSLAC
ncbi:MAG TPA: LysR family transcriptional regulator [Burkholderiaceae bacterium]|nr:LysR family transcriptional regulator [Burkholderiaceae bacterium]